MTRGNVNHRDRERVALGLFGENLFGPQSQWSSLLVQRERLKSEIKHAETFLDELRKDVARPKATKFPRRQSGQNGVARLASDKDTLEQYVAVWLAGLRERLGHVNAEVSSLVTRGEQRAEHPEETLFTLLRGMR